MFGRPLEWIDDEYIVPAATGVVRFAVTPPQEYRRYRSITIESLAGSSTRLIDARTRGPSDSQSAATPNGILRQRLGVNGGAGFSVAAGDWWNFPVSQELAPAAVSPATINTFADVCENGALEFAISSVAGQAIFRVSLGFERITEEGLRHEMIDPGLRFNPKTGRLVNSKFSEAILQRVVPV